MKKMPKIHNLKHLSVVALLFVLSSAIVFALDADINKNIGIGIDLAGILMGAALILFIIKILKSFKGALRKAFGWIMYGISFQVLALVYTLVFLRFKLYPIPLNIEMHHLMMIIGIVFFAMATYNLRKMMAELDEKS